MSLVLSNILLNREFKTKFLENYTTIFTERQARYKNAFENFMGDDFKNLPKETLPEINSKIELLTKFLNSSNTDDNQRQNLNHAISSLQQRINENDYVVEGSAEHNYKLAYEEKKKSFVWPDANELSLQQNEETQALSLLNAN